MTHYVGGVRKTLNGEEGTVADLAQVRSHFAEGCSVRLSWPQRHSEPVWAMLAQLEEHFGCGGGANVYHTPAGCQGFAPHWDDINAFVVQLEGEKTWRLYKPRSEAEVLPRFSSPNLAQDELGDLIAEITLRPGEMLYLPRGLVHQAVSGEVDSLHLTVSIGRQHSWHELVELGVLGAIEQASLEHREWREQLPTDFLSSMGVIHSESGADEQRQERRAAITDRIKGMLEQVPPPPQSSHRSRDEPTATTTAVTYSSLLPPISHLLTDYPPHPPQSHLTPFTPPSSHHMCGRLSRSCQLTLSAISSSASVSCTTGAREYLGEWASCVCSFHVACVGSVIVSCKRFP